MSTYAIADIGANHDGRLANMDAAIHAAKEAGADAIKFQWTSDARRMAERRGAAVADGYAEVYERYLRWPVEWHAALAQACRTVGIDYMCTVFIPQDAAVVAPHVRHFKVASFEAQDTALLDAIDAVRDAERQWLIVSMGMASDYARPPGPWREGLKELLCVSAYPAPVETLGLARLWPHCGSCECDASYRCGFSDHTLPELGWTGALAVAAGAEIVEAHLRLHDTDPRNPDYAHAMNPGQFEAYVRHIRFAEACLADDEPLRARAEAPMARYRVGPGAI